MKLSELMEQLDHELAEVQSAQIEVEESKAAYMAAKSRLDQSVVRTRELQRLFREKVDGVIGEKSDDRVR